jgi:hypothetical protein
MQGRFDTDDDDEQAVFTLNLRRSCDALLADLTQGERLPANMPDTNLDRYPRFFPTPFLRERVGLAGSHVRRSRCAARRGRRPTAMRIVAVITATGRPCGFGATP